MRKAIGTSVVLCLLAMAAIAVAATPERYLHVRVEDQSKSESVSVNLPLSMAEKILPTVNHGNLHQGRVTVTHGDIEGVDLRTILDALQTTADGEFVTVKQTDQDVRVAKSNGNLVVHVRDTQKEGQKVDITVPLKVVDALFSTAKQDELDILAAIRALGEAGETVLVTVEDETEHVRIWVDSRADQGK
jgi:hypothetical protein